MKYHLIWNVKALADVFPSSSAAEQVTVNHWVVGSNPTSGAKINSALSSRFLYTPSRGLERFVLKLFYESFCFRAVE